MSDTVWKYEEGTYTLQEICYKHPPPVVVKLSENSDEPKRDLDSRDPLLVYRQRNINKVTAHNVQRELYMEAGPPLLIPEDYKGWFAILQKKQRNPVTLRHDVMEYKLVSDLANSDTETFLIGGKEQVNALQMSISVDGKSQHLPRSIFPGEVLRKGKIYVGQTKRKSGFLRLKSKMKQEYYLLCTDDCDREILLPFNEKGVFYTLTTQSDKMKCPVMQMKDIIDKKILPATVKLLFGRVPLVSSAFTGFLRLEHSHFERSIIACKVSDKNGFLELPLSSPLSFRIVDMNMDVVSSEAYKKAYSTCNEKAHIYMRGIKVCTNSNDIFSEELEEEMPLPSPHILRKKKSVASSVGSSEENRESGYIEMRDSLELPDESYMEMNQLQSMKGTIDLDDMDYVLPISDRHESLRRTRSSCRSPPPTCSPPPLPTACLGPLHRTYTDSGISDPPQTTRSNARIDKVSSDQIYDIPKIPRRLSAPDAFDTYTISTQKPNSLEILDESEKGESIKYENFSILREVVPKACERKSWNKQKKQIESKHDEEMHKSVENTERVVFDLEDKNSNDMQNVEEMGSVNGIAREPCNNSEHSDKNNTEGSSHSDVNQIGLKIDQNEQSQSETQQLALLNGTEVKNENCVNNIEYLEDTDTNEEQNQQQMTDGTRDIEIETDKTTDQSCENTRCLEISQESLSEDNSCKDTCEGQNDNPDKDSEDAKTENKNLDYTTEQEHNLSDSSDNTEHTECTDNHEIAAINLLVDAGKNADDLSESDITCDHLYIDILDADETSEISSTTPPPTACNNRVSIYHYAECPETDSNVTTVEIQESDNNGTTVESQEVLSELEENNLSSNEYVQQNNQNDKENRTEQEESNEEEANSPGNFNNLEDVHETELDNVTSSEETDAESSLKCEIISRDGESQTLEIVECTTETVSFEEEIDSENVIGENKEQSEKNVNGNLEPGDRTEGTISYSDKGDMSQEQESNCEKIIHKMNKFGDESDSNPNEFCEISRGCLSEDNSCNDICEGQNENQDKDSEASKTNNGNHDRTFELEAIEKTSSYVSESTQTDQCELEIVNDLQNKGNTIDKFKNQNVNTSFDQDKTKQPTSPCCLDQSVNPCNETNVVDDEEEDELSRMTANEIVSCFKKLGIKRNVTDMVQKRNLKGSDLKDLQKLTDIFPGISCVDRRKISMFLQGMMQSEYRSDNQEDRQPIFV